jgi:hypothetical protein
MRVLNAARSSFLEERPAPRSSIISGTKRSVKKMPFQSQTITAEDCVFFVTSSVSQFRNSDNFKEEATRDDLEARIRPSALEQ